MKRRVRKKTEPSWYWIDGATKLHGVKVWMPLYNARSETAAQHIFPMVKASMNGQGNPKEIETLKRYRDFRIRPDTQQDVRCTCTSNYLKRIRREDQRLWKCLNCGRAWRRDRDGEPNAASNGSVRPAEARKRPVRTLDTPRKRSTRLKKPQGAVSKRAKS